MKINFRSLFVFFILSACTGFQRSDDAAMAKAHMLGMSREEVLTCMGIPKKKASEGNTEVWSYLSTDGRSDSDSDLFKSTGYAHTNTSRTRSFCTVNVVMKNGMVDAVRYNGPTSSYLFTPDDQCGFAVANCLKK